MSFHCFLNRNISTFVVICEHLAQDHVIVVMVTRTLAVVMMVMSTYIYWPQFMPDTFTMCHCSKGFTCINSLNSYDNFIR